MTMINKFEERNFNEYCTQLQDSKIHVVSFGISGDTFIIQIGSCGRNFDQVKTFKAKKISTISLQITKFLFSKN